MHDEKEIISDFDHYLKEFIDLIEAGVPEDLAVQVCNTTRILIPIETPSNFFIMLIKAAAKRKQGIKITNKEEYFLSLLDEARENAKK